VARARPHTGADSRYLYAYVIAGHPNADEQQVEESIRFATSLGIKVMVSEFSPIPGTPDGEMCRQWVDLEEPLSHNKTFFTILSLGDTQINRLKNLALSLNQRTQALNGAAIAHPLPTGTFF
jgi:hypothetical protein